MGMAFGGKRLGTVRARVKSYPEMPIYSWGSSTKSRMR